jgi:lipopolysaccharide export system protein LptA
MPARAPASRSLLLALLFLVPAAAAQEQAGSGEEEPPLVVESNEMVIRDAEKKAIYTGDVVATKADMTLRSDRLVVEYTEAGMQRAHAYGSPVRMRQRDRRGHADEAIYFAADRSVLLIGSAHLEEGPNVVDGARIRYFLDQRRTEVYSAEDGEEGGRARAVYHPDSPPEGAQDGGEGDPAGDE